MTNIDFHPIDLADSESVRNHVYSTECRNCDLNFMNLMGWRFLYQTELAFYQNWLLIRFKVDGHLAYLPPVGEGDLYSVLQVMINDAQTCNEKFRLMGVCEHSLDKFNEIMPSAFDSTFDRSYSDYLYSREKLVTLSGKKLQPKRNFIHRFEDKYPDYEYLPLTQDSFEDCLILLDKWYSKKEMGQYGKLGINEERNALKYVFGHWNDLCGQGGVLKVNGKIVAFTYGSAINYDTFDVCVEKADSDYEGAFPMINREFAKHLPSAYVYVNREEDLGIEGLRKAKMSYQPEVILNKHILTLGASF